MQYIQNTWDASPYYIRIDFCIISNFIPKSIKIEQKSTIAEKRKPQQDIVLLRFNYFRLSFVKVVYFTSSKSTSVTS